MPSPASPTAGAARDPMMRVLLVCHGYPPLGVAGVERLSAQTAAALTKRGHEVRVLTRQLSERPVRPALQHEVRDGVPVTSVVGAGTPPEWFPGDESVMERIFERTIVEFRPDVVLATHLLHHSPGYVDVAHRWGVPIVLELHDFFMLCPRIHLQRRSGELCDGPEAGAACARHCFGDQDGAQLRWSLRSRTFAEAVRQADEVLAPSQFVVDAFAEMRGEERPIRIVDNAVPVLGPVLRTQPEADAPLRLASIGITVEHKGFQVVVEALRLAGLPRVSYTVLGVALQPLASELREAADEIAGLDFRLFGGFSPTHLPALLADADVVVVPSLVAETFSIVAREAFACGLPVIASRIGALPAAIRPGDNGWLFEPGAAVELAELLRRLHHDRALLGRAAEGIQAGDVTAVAARAARIEALLAEAVERPRADRERGGDRELLLMREALAAADAVGG